MNATLKKLFPLSPALSREGRGGKIVSYLHTHAFQLVVALGSALAALSGIVPAEAGLLPMLLLNTDGAGGDSSNTSSEASGGGTPAPAAGDNSSGKPAPAAAPETKPESSAPRQKAAVAHDRAADRLAKAKAAKAKTTTAAPAQDTDPGQPGAGTEGKPGEGKQAPQPGEGEPGQEKPPVGDPPPADSAKAPENWTADRQAKFNAAPPEARAVILDFHKEMSAGVTHVLTQLSQERSRHQDLFALNEKFNSGPDGAREVLTGLAKQANIELFFEAPAAEGTVPEEVLKDPAKLTKYIEDRAVARAAKERQADTEKAAKEARAVTAREQLTREFQDAVKAHTDFATHKPAVTQLLQKAPSLSVEEAYRAVTHDALVKLANEAPALKQELATVKAELDALKKKATALPPGGGPGAQKGEDKFLSPGERAFRRAEKKATARGAHA
jgi:hypothetical protein